MGPYHVVDFPAERRGMPRFNNMYWGRHCIYGLLEVDVTAVRQLMMVFDHDVIDGPPATRFTRRLVELIESGYGLDEDPTLTAVDNEPEAIDASAFTAGVRFDPSSAEQVSTYAGGY